MNSNDERVIRFKLRLMNFNLLQWSDVRYINGMDETIDK